MTDGTPPARPTSYDKKVGLVLQGGGALGSYQAGVYEAKFNPLRDGRSSKVACRLLSYSVVVESGAVAYVRVTPIAGCAVRLLKSSKTPTL